MGINSKFKIKSGQKKDTQKNCTGEIFNIPPYLICPSPLLPRTDFSDTSLCSLADSIRRYGMLQPLCVCLSKDGKYELVAGERRLRAALLLKLPTVPCVLVGSYGKDAEYLSVIENIQREGLNMFDEAKAIKRLMERDKISQEQLALILSSSTAQIEKKLRLTQFSRAEMQEILHLGISPDIASLFLDVPCSVRYYTIKLCTEKELNESSIRTVCKRLSEIKNPSPDDLEEILSKVIIKKEESSIEDTEQSEKADIKEKRTQKIVLHDLRSFEISLEKSCDVLRRAGLYAGFDKQENNSETVYTVRVKKE